MLWQSVVWAHENDVPPGFAVQADFVTGLVQPTDIKFARDGRIFVSEKSGQVRIVENGILLETPFYTVQTQTPNERGLDGIALDPDFDLNGFVYLFYTLPLENKNVVTRVTSAGNTAVPGSEVELFRMDKMWAAWHNGGAMVFDTDGKLIVAQGDGVGRNPQFLDHLNGKIHRLNKDGTIPEDNPFYDVLTGDERAIAAYGIRNPYTMAISRLSGKIFFNDVGDEAYEEVNELIFGKNYGWYPIEGPLGNAAPPDSNYTDPIFAYNHDIGCAVVGASFYEPEIKRFPESYFGKYFFMDLCQGTIWYMDPETKETKIFGQEFTYGYSNLEVSPDGDLYLISVEEGNIARITYQGLDAVPVISAQPVAQTAAAGEDATFSVDVAGEGVIYTWFRDGIVAKTGNSSDLTLPSVASNDDQAAVFVVVSNANGFVGSDTVRLTVVEGARPTVTFGQVSPTYRAGDSIYFSAMVSDEDQAAVPLADMTWQIDFHHDAHTHPALQATSGIPGGVYYVERFGEVDTNVFFRIHLLVTDSSGLSTEAFTDVLPEKVSVNLESQPAGVHFLVDGREIEPGEPLRSVENLGRTLEAPAYAVIGDSLYQFVEWWDGSDTLGRVIHAQPGTLSAQYAFVQPWEAFLPANGTLEFYWDTTGTQPVYETRDVAAVRENWDVWTPYPYRDPRFPNDYWSAKWEGPFFAPVSDYYTFYLLHDGRASLTLGDEVLIPATMAPGDFAEDSVRVWLEAGTASTIRVDYDHFDYIARVELDWKYSVVERQPVPFAKADPRTFLQDDSDGFSLFPNPATGEEVHLWIDRSRHSYHSYRLQVMDMSGKLVHAQNGLFDTDLVAVPVGQMPAGTYLFRLVVGPHAKVMRFVKTR
ncbi:MAG: PQQ-dependent sugar dehydrogenase [Bacteroidota bacterium]